jgi:hypothetical protein
MSIRLCQRSWTLWFFIKVVFGWDFGFRIFFDKMAHYSEDCEGWDDSSCYEAVDVGHRWWSILGKFGISIAAIMAIVNRRWGSGRDEWKVLSRTKDHCEFYVIKGVSDGRIYASCQGTLGSCNGYYVLTLLPLRNKTFPGGFMMALKWARYQLEIQKPRSNSN